LSEKVIRRKWTSRYSGRDPALRRFNPMFFDFCKGSILRCPVYARSLSSATTISAGSGGIRFTAAWQPGGDGCKQRYRECVRENRTKCFSVFMVSFRSESPVIVAHPPRCRYRQKRSLSAFFAGWLLCLLQHSDEAWSCEGSVVVDCEVDLLALRATVE